MKNTDVVFITGALWVLAFISAVVFMIYTLTHINFITVIGICISMHVLTDTIKTIIKHILKGSKGEPLTE